MVLISCKEIHANLERNLIYFEYPQPINDSELSKIPNKYVGIFMNNNSVFLNIDNDFIIEKYTSKIKIATSEMDSLKNEFTFKNNYMISKDEKEKYSFCKLKDSLEITINAKNDTVFRFNSNQKAKRINGNLVLSEKENTYWKVKLISLSDKTLKIKHLISDNDLKKLDSLTKKKSKRIDSSTYLINPTRSEFGKLFKLKNLGYDKDFKKVK